MRRSKMDKNSDKATMTTMMIKKGPWTAEEDEVLLKFVNRYGPRDWSSIRTMGLLPRTGKSCRLRWVNKLRPNLKIGCKFTAEEERVVIELQERFGNKWATIASYLHGRTDNDVKNFWSTRQKRLARMTILSPPPPPPPPVEDEQQVEVVEMISSSSKMEESSSNSSDMILMQIVSFNTNQLSHPEFLFPDSMITGLHFNIPNPPITITTTTTTDEIIPPLLQDCPIFVKPPSGFHQIQNDGERETEMKPDFLDVFPASSYETTQLLMCCCDESMGMMEWNNDHVSDEKEDIEKLGTPDGFFDDLPADIFDCIDPVPPSLPIGVARKDDDDEEEENGL